MCEVNVGPLAVVQVCSSGDWKLLKMRGNTSPTSANSMLGEKQTLTFSRQHLPLKIVANYELQ